MAHSQNFLNAIAAINALTADELNSLVAHWKAASRSKRATQAAEVIVNQKFNHGDILGWVVSRGRQRGMRYYFKFERMNRAGTAAQGPTCTKDGVVTGGKCTVFPMHIDILNGKVIK